MPQHDFAQEVIDQQQLDFEALQMANELDTAASSSEGLGKGLGKNKAFVDGQGQGPSGWREKCAVLVILAPLASFRAFQNTFQNAFQNSKTFVENLPSFSRTFQAVENRQLF